MKKSIILLNKELCEWKEHYENEKIYYNGNELQGSKSFAQCVVNISDLQQAIDILEKQNVTVQKTEQIFQFVEWIQEDGEWYFSDGLWHKEGWKSRTTKELFEYYITHENKSAIPKSKKIIL